MHASQNTRKRARNEVSSTSTQPISSSQDDADNGQLDVTSDSSAHPSNLNPNVHARIAQKERKFEGKSDAEILVSLVTWLRILCRNCCLALQKKNWRSAVYGHFKEPVIIRHNSDVKYKFICKRCVDSVYSIFYIY
jgi:hypothetical protein